jgi:hypothetical protein
MWNDGRAAVVESLTGVIQDFEELLPTENSGRVLERKN